MTSTERARAFIGNKLKRTALIILPLAAAAVQAHAGVIFTLGSGSNPMQASGNTTTSVTTPFSSTPILNGVDGISLFGAANYTVNFSGSGSNGIGSCQNVCGGFFTFGGGSGSFASDTLLTNYDFILSDSNGDPLVWFLSVQVNGSSGSANGTVASGTEVTNSLTLSGLNGQTLESWNASLQVDFGAGFSSGDTLTVTIPGGASVDIGAVTPEPGTGSLMAMAGAALAGFAAIRRRLS